MSEPKISIFTCSYNKPQYVAQAINSVLEQTYPNFEYFILENSTDNVTRSVVQTFTDDRIRLIEVDFSSRERRKFYVESYLKSAYALDARGQFIMYLSDDDLLEPTCFAQHIQEFARDQAQSINFHGWRIIYLGTDKAEEIIGVKNRYGLGTERRPGRRIDGGAVMFKKKLLTQLSDPYFKLTWKDAHISDALFLNRLAQIATFYPINKILHTKRITDISTHGFIDKAGHANAYRPA